MLFEKPPKRAAASQLTRPRQSLSTWQYATSRKQAAVSKNGLRHETSSLSYTQNGSINDPLKPHGPTFMHRVSDTPYLACVSISAALQAASKTGLWQRRPQKFEITFYEFVSALIFFWLII